MIWFKQARSANIPVNGTLLRGKALEIAEKLNVDFTPSNGWIDRMKKRAGLVYKTIKGDCNSVDLQEAEEWKAKLPEIISGYQPKNIFNMDECGLFFNLLPDKTFAFKGEPCHGGKNSKERLTILVGASMNGIEKLPILVIGKSKKPRCFRNVKSLPCDYDSNQKSWMTIKIFETYLKKLDSKMRKEKRNIIIFVDNCAAHSKENKYTNIKLQFLPPNSTSVLQPMDQGVIKVFKQHYKMRLVKRMLEGLENTGELKKVNMLEAIELIVSAWELITPSAIANCFRKAGFSDGDTTEEYLLEAEYEISDEDEETNDICDVTNDTEEFSETEEDIAKPPSFSDARKGLDTFRKCIYTVENVPPEMFKFLQQLDNFHLKVGEKRQKQTTLHDFFSQKSS
nr:tigger transposable element-derived protein 4-like [Parasteatoda tepidariorum]